MDRSPSNLAVAMALAPEDPPKSRDAVGERHLVIAIHGVGNHSSGEMKKAIKQAIQTMRGPAAAAVEVEEFNWNEFVPHAPRRGSSVAGYASWFSRSFIAAAWQRERPRRLLDRCQCVVHAAFHLVLAVGATIVTLCAAAAVSALLLSRILAASQWWTLPWESIGWWPPELSTDLGRGATVLFGIAESLVAWCGGLLGLVAAASITVSVLASAAALSFAPLFTCLRRLVFLLLLVPAVLLSLVLLRPSRQPDDRGERLGRTALAWTLYAFYFLIGGVVGVVTGTFWTTMLIIGGSALLRLATTSGRDLAVGLRQTAGAVWLTGAKVLLDVSLYIGSPEYRRQLQTNLEALIDKMRGTERVDSIWLVGHSLGSVIALDCLVNSSVWMRNEVVCLVTLGSPIKRLINRFFPAYLFSRDVRHAAGVAAQRVRQLTWLNIYRPLDYVGGALGLKGAGTDVRARQRWRLHTNYWSDPTVLKALREKLPGALPVRSSVEIPGSSGLQELGAPASVEAPARALLAARHYATIGMIVLGTAFAVLPKSLQTGRWPEVHIATPIRSVAAVTHERSFSWGKNRSGRIHTFTFSITSPRPGAPPLRETFRVYGASGLGTSASFDTSSFLDFVREDCRPVRRKRWYQFGWSQPCVREGVRVEYDANNPSQLVALDFLPRRTVLRRVLRWVVAIGVLVVGVWLLIFLSDFAVETAGRFLRFLTGTLPLAAPLESTPETEQLARGEQVSPGTG